MATGHIDTEPFFWDFLKIVLLRKYEGLKMKLAKTLSRHFVINCCLISNVNTERNFTKLMKRNHKNRIAIGTFVLTVSEKK